MTPEEQLRLRQGQRVMVQWVYRGEPRGPYTVEIIRGIPYAAMAHEVGTGKVQWDRSLDPRSYPHAKVTEVVTEGD